MSSGWGGEYGLQPLTKLLETFGPAIISLVLERSANFHSNLLLGLVEQTFVQESVPHATTLKP